MDNYAPIFKIISIVCFSVAGLSLIIALILFFKFRIISVIGDLSGRTARKSIEKMREENEKSGVKSHRPTALGKARGPITKEIEDYTLNQSLNATEPLHGNPQEPQPKDGYAQASQATAPIPMSGGAPAAPPARQGANTLEKEKSNVSDNVVTPPRQAPGQATTVLNDGTQVLDQSEINKRLNVKKMDMKLIQNLILVHTDEYI